MAAILREFSVEESYQQGSQCFYLGTSPDFEPLANPFEGRTNLYHLVYREAEGRYWYKFELQEAQIDGSN